MASVSTQGVRNIKSCSYETSNMAAENIRLAHKEVFSPLSLHISPILMGCAAQDKSTNPSGSICGCKLAAPRSSLLAPHTCQVWKCQEGPTIWAAGGVFPRETPGQMVVATPGLVIVQRKSPVAPVNLLTTEWSEMKSYTGISRFKFLEPFWFPRARQSGTDYMGS